MDRREFLTKSGLAMALVGVSVTVTSCGDDSPSEPSNGSSNDVTGNATGSGHTHTGTITAAQLAAGVVVDITFSGGTHTHLLRVEAPDVQSIAQGTRVQIDFTDNRHPHTYTFN